MCDPIWHVSSRSGEAGMTANCYICMLYLLCKYNRVETVLVLNELLQYMMIKVIVIKDFWVSNLQWVLMRCITL